jgi:signal transduction histidine kinase
LDLSLPAAQLVTGTTAAVTAVMYLARSHSTLPGHKWFVLANFASIWWLVSIGMELSVTSGQCKVVWAQLAWVGIVLLPTFWSFFLYEYALSKKVGLSTVILGAFLSPALIFIATVTNSIHQLFYGPKTSLVLDGSKAYVEYEHGPLFFASVGYLYFIILVSCIISARAVVNAMPVVKGFFKSLFVITFIPVLANAAYIFYDLTIFDVDPTPFSFAISILLIFWLMTDKRWVDASLIARDILFHNSNDLIFVLDELGALREANKAAQDFIKCQSSSKGSLFEIDGLGDVFRGIATDQRILDGLEVKSGSRHFVARAYPISLGPTNSRLGWVVPFIDVTILKVAAEQAIRSERLQAQFLSTVSHELRTPLTVITGSLALYRGNKDNLADAQAARLIELTSKNAATLARLVNELIETQRLGTSDYKLTCIECDANEVIEDAVASMETFLPEKKVEVLHKRLTHRVPIWADFDKLRQVIANILSNAVKFSDVGMCVEVQAHREADTVFISVTDSGPGIPPKSEETVFGRFSQIDQSDTKKVYGSGLGMYIAKQIMRHHGGDISYVSELGVGTTFTIAIPMRNHS